MTSPVLTAAEEITSYNLRTRRQIDLACKKAKLDSRLREIQVERKVLTGELRLVAEREREGVMSQLGNRGQ